MLTDSMLLKPNAVVNIVAHGWYITEREVIDPTAGRTLISENVLCRLGAKMMKIGRSDRVFLVVRCNYDCSDTVETYAEMRRQIDSLTPSRSTEGKLADVFPGPQLADSNTFLASPWKIIRNGVFAGTMDKKFLGT